MGGHSRVCGPTNLHQLKFVLDGSCLRAGTRDPLSFGREAATASAVVFDFNTSLPCGPVWAKRTNKGRLNFLPLSLTAWCRQREPTRGDHFFTSLSKGPVWAKKASKGRLNIFTSLPCGPVSATRTNKRSANIFTSSSRPSVNKGSQQWERELYQCGEYFLSSLPRGLGRQREPTRGA